MKWVLVEVNWNGEEHEMPTKYNKIEDAEKDRRIFYWENPHKTFLLREVKEEKKG